MDSVIEAFNNWTKEDVPALSFVNHRESGSLVVYKHPNKRLMASMIEKWLNGAPFNETEEVLWIIILSLLKSVATRKEVREFVEEKDVHNLLWSAIQHNKQK